MGWKTDFFKGFRSANARPSAPASSLSVSTLQAGTPGLTDLNNMVLNPKNKTT
jgi:hypothetical protein